jgi:hypothetical protein
MNLTRILPLRCAYHLSAEACLAPNVFISTLRGTVCKLFAGVHLCKKARSSWSFSSKHSSKVQGLRYLR